MRDSFQKMTEKVSRNKIYINISSQLTWTSSVAAERELAGVIKLANKAFNPTDMGRIRHALMDNPADIPHDPVDLCKDMSAVWDPYYASFIGSRWQQFPYPGVQHITQD